MLITTKDNIKALLGSNSSTNDDLLLEAFALSVSAAVEKYIARGVETTERTEYHDVEAGQSYFLLKAYPVDTAESIAVYNDSGRTFGTALGSSNYTVLGDLGGLSIDGYSLIDGPRVLKVVYTGGLAATQEALEAAYPDIEMAARIQGAAWFERRKSLSTASVSVAGSSVSVGGELDFLPQVKSLLVQYRRDSYA